MTFVVGLTGGIGSGKTTVANLFAAAGVDVVDTDEISHRLTQAGMPAIAAIAERFGDQFIDACGSLCFRIRRHATTWKPSCTH
jgi:dephospho-CoA kinase